MTERQSQRWKSFKVISVILFLLVAYPLGLGPVMYFYDFIYDFLPEPVEPIAHWIFMAYLYPIDYFFYCLGDYDWFIDTIPVQWYGSYIQSWGGLAGGLGG